MIETIKVKLLNSNYYKSEWECVLEIPIDYNLEELHEVILWAVGFDNDHMYEFCIGNSFSSKNSEHLFCDEDIVIQETVDTIFLRAKGKKIFYMFDYGDSWYFQINKSRKKRFSEKEGISYPQVVLESGLKPKQYPN